MYNESLIIEKESKKEKEKFNLKPFGQAIQDARIGKGWTREHLAEQLGLSSKYLQYIEIRGQHPSFQVLYKIATLLNISIDQFLFPCNDKTKTTRRRQIDVILDCMDEKDLSVIFATAYAMQEVKSESFTQ